MLVFSHYTAPIHFDSERVQTVGVSNIVGLTNLPGGSRFLHPKPLYVQVVSEDGPAPFKDWERLALAKVPEDERDPMGSYGWLCLEGDPSDPVPDEVHCVIEAEGAPEGWERVTIAIIDPAYWDEYGALLDALVGRGRYVAANSRTLVEVHPTQKRQVPSTWKAITRGEALKHSPGAVLR